MGMHLMDGNEAVAWAAHDAGCRFFAGYPITPATGIFNAMLEILPPAGGVCLQGEDEIASIGMCLGASMAGHKVMTATSGPGISLYSEHLSFAIGSEIPVVIVDVQRLGPSTGSATRAADGDIQFLRWGCSGGMPVIVLAPADAVDCYRLTRQAFNLAETYRCPVFVASNKEVGLTREGIDLQALPRPEVKDRAAFQGPGPFLPFAAGPGQDVPAFLPMGGQTLVRQTSSTHGPDGYITTDPEAIGACVARLQRKLLAAVDSFTFSVFEGSQQARVMILTYGVTARAARSALEQLLDRGVQASLLVLQTLWPVPEAVIAARAARAEQVLVVEMNLGQLVNEVERVLKPKPVRFLGRMNGQLITPGEIMEAVQDERLSAEH